MSFISIPYNNREIFDIDMCSRYRYIAVIILCQHKTNLIYSNESGPGTRSIAKWDGGEGAGISVVIWIKEMTVLVISIDVAYTVTFETYSNIKII
jgi:hypothetical protein